MADIEIDEDYEPSQYDCIDSDGINRGDDHDYGPREDRECSRCGAEPPTD